MGSTEVRKSDKTIAFVAVWKCTLMKPLCQRGRVQRNQRIHIYWNITVAYKLEKPIKNKKYILKDVTCIYNLKIYKKKIIAKTYINKPKLSCQKHAQRKLYPTKNRHEHTNRPWKSDATNSHEQGRAKQGYRSRERQQFQQPTITQVPLTTLLGQTALWGDCTNCKFNKIDPFPSLSWCYQLFAFFFSLVGIRYHGGNKLLSLVLPLWFNMGLCREIYFFLDYICSRACVDKHIHYIDEHIHRNEHVSISLDMHIYRIGI